LWADRGGDACAAPTGNAATHAVAASQENLRTVNISTP
jgi:hypothetical protein